jgi:hypothetical protein
LARRFRSKAAASGTWARRTSIGRYAGFSCARTSF